MADYTKTVAELVDLVLARVRSGSGSSDTLYNQTLNDLNLALQEMAILFPWKWLKTEKSVTVPAGTRLCNPSTVSQFPTDIINIISILAVVSNQETEMIQLSDQEADEMFPDLTTLGTMQYYTITSYIANTASQAARALEFRPAPQFDTVLNIKYTKNFKLYSSGNASEVIPMPSSYYSALIELTASRVLRFTKANPTEINDARNLALLTFQQLAKRDADKKKKTAAIRLPRNLLDYRAGRYG